MTKQALLLVSHGSRRSQSNSEVVRLTDQIRPLVKDRYSWVEAAFLELAQPSIPDGIQAVIQAGAEKVWILPYFLAAGRHVVEDIPGIVAQVQEQYPEVKIGIISHLGAAEEMPNLLAEIALTDLS